MKHFLILLFVISIFSCNYIPCSSSSDLESVVAIDSMSELDGIYQPDTFTKQDFGHYFNLDSSFLEINGSQLQLKNVPLEILGSFNLLTKELVNGFGTWSYTLQSATITINTKLTFSQAGIYSLSPFRLFKKDDKFYILLDFGDPDVCSSIRFRQN